jgi:DNA-binding response OmpR family regulator
MKPGAMVLVVDDELDTCLMVTQYLQRLQFKTHYATTLNDAQHKIKTIKFDLMFIDLTLPDGSGFDIVRHTADLQLTSKIIIMSAHDNLAAEAYAMGVNVFITKPFTTRTIREVLHSIQFLLPDTTTINAIAR